MIVDASRIEPLSSPISAGRTAHRRYLALWFPFLSTDRVWRTARKPPSAKPGDVPLVLVEKEQGTIRLAALDQAGIRGGLVFGMALADAWARMPRLHVLPMDRQADEACLQAYAATIELFTPLVALDGRDGLLLDITGCFHLFGGEAEFYARVCRQFTRLGLTVRASISGTPDSARTIARFGVSGLVPAGEEERTTRILPVTALDMSTEVTLSLTRAGLKTLGDIADRPSRIITARFGGELVAKLARILGHEDIRITPLRPPPDCLAERHFAEPILEPKILQGTLAKLAQDVCLVLEQRGAGGRRFEVSLFRSDGAVQRLAIETGTPCRDPAIILHLLKTRIETLADPVDPGFGFDAVRLAAPVAEPMAAHQPSLDSHTVAAGAVSDLHDRLVVRFGRERVLQFVTGDTHDPVRASRMIPVTAEVPSRTAVTPEPDGPPLRPITLFDPPQLIEALAEVPDGPPLRFRWRRVLHEVARSEGPERIAPDWWLENANAAATRDYYRIENTHGHRFWVFREGLYEDSNARPRWFLHGLFA